MFRQLLRAWVVEQVLVLPVAETQILALANGDEKMRDATPAGLSLSEQLLKIHALTIKEQRNLLIGRHFRHPAFYSASNQNPVLAAP